jgi:uncharacterized alpha-E superfamily protein
MIFMPETVVPTSSKYTFNRLARPMLARDADSMYWMSRYVERAEHVARIVWVNSNLLVDVGDLAPALQERQWESVLTIFNIQSQVPGDGPIGPRMLKYMTFSEDNPNSIYSCLSRARENARGIREQISSEMWENLNTMYWSLRAEDAPARFEEGTDDFFRSIMTGSHLFQGMTDQTMAHDQRWLFAQLGKYLERIAVTCRVIETKFGILRGAEKMLEAPLRNIHWMAVLRSCCSIEAYRRNHVGDMDPLKVATFLMMEENFPRTVRYSVHHAHQAISRLRAEINPRTIDDAERILGRLDTQLEYAEMREILAEGLPAYLQVIQTHVADAAMAVQKAYFLH